MTLQKLEALIQEAKSELTKEQFENLDVLISTDETHHNPIENLCGVCEVNIQDSQYKFFLITSDSDVIVK